MQGKQRSTSFLKIDESKNVFAVDFLIGNRFRVAKTLEQWVSLVDSQSTDSVLVPQIETDPLPTSQAIDWGESEPISFFGAPENIGLPD